MFYIFQFNSSPTVQYKKRVEEQHNRIKDEAAKKAKAKELAEKVTNSEDGKTEPGSETGMRRGDLAIVLIVLRLLLIDGMDGYGQQI